MHCNEVTKSSQDIIPCEPVLHLTKDHRKLHPEECLYCKNSKPSLRHTPRIQPAESIRESLHCTLWKTGANNQ